jgi:hypothetical protein
MSDDTVFHQCFCGTTRGIACLNVADGPCRDQTMAATKATGYTEAGMRFFEFNYPSGYATQEVTCRFDFCGATAMPPHTNACPL